MELHQLRYFVAAAHHGTITRASESLYLSQPSLSEQIRKLERELGTPLFERLGRRLVLTAAGAAFLPHAERSLFEVEEGRTRVREVLGMRRGRVAIGAPPSVSAQVLPGVLAAFKRVNPGVEVVLKEALASARFESMVHAGELDMAVIRLPGSRPDLEYRTLLREPMLALVPPSHRLAERRRIAVAELADEEFVSLSPEFGIRDIMMEICHRAGFEPRVVAETGQMTVILRLVGVGVGVTILPRMAAGDETPALALDDPDAAREMAVCYRAGRPLSPPAMGLLDLLIEATSGPAASR
jgi:LysR family transcriptional regulator, hydrogen peroxide-inducible genes activator